MVPLQPLCHPGESLTTPALYDAASLDVRGGLAEAHRAALEHFAKPGTWWTAKERLEIFRESRQALECELCEKRKLSLSPYGVDGSHDSLGNLDDHTVEAVHRMRTDPGRLTKTWFDAISAQMDAGPYVELIAVVSVSVIIDTFTESLGLAFLELPPPAEGEPSRKTFDQAAEDGAWVAITKPNPETRANIVRALGLIPPEQGNCWQVFTHHYLSPDGRAIAQPQIELMAARTSALNQCFY